MIENQKGAPQWKSWQYCVVPAFKNYGLFQIRSQSKSNACDRIQSKQIEKSTKSTRVLAETSITKKPRLESD